MSISWCATSWIFRTVPHPDDALRSMRHGHACGRVLRDVRRAPVGAARRRPGPVAHRRIRGGTGRARAAVVNREYVVPAPASPLAGVVSGGDGAVVPGDGRIRAAALA